MSVKWPWLLVALIPIVAMVIVRWRHPAKKPVRYVGDSSTLSGLPSLKRVTQRARWLKIGELTTMGLLVVVLVVIAARPQREIRKIETSKSRDIVLCMDVSGSMREYIQPAFSTVRKIVKENPTDRYSVVLFRNAPYVALPLTNDTAAIDVIIKDLCEEFNSSGGSAADLIGFAPGVEGGTDIGAGLAGCFRRFDAIEQKRSRHIIFVSDMDNNGLTDQEAVATLLPKYDIKLYVLAPGGAFNDATQSPVVQITGAPVETLSEGGDFGSVLERIYSTILNTRKDDVYVSADAPYPYWAAATVLTAAWTAILLVRWRR